MKLEEEIYTEIDNLRLEITEKVREIENKILNLELENKENSIQSNDNKQENDSELESIESNLRELEVLNINNSTKDNSENEYRFTNHSENELTSNTNNLTNDNLTNNTKEEEVNMNTEGESSGTKPEHRYYKERPIAGNYDFKRKTYGINKRDYTIWSKRLQGKYKIKHNMDPEILDLDCPESIEKSITSWVGQARIYLESLKSQEKELLEGHVDINGTIITTSTAMLKKIEILIRREFGDLNADTIQQDQDKLNALNILKGIELYLDFGKGEEWGGDEVI
ncbi:hypothetical protein Tco_0699152 [Tanacetum coccineum]